MLLLFGLLYSDCFPFSILTLFCSILSFGTSLIILFFRSFQSCASASCMRNFCLQFFNLWPFYVLSPLLTFCLVRFCFPPLFLKPAASSAPLLPVVPALPFSMQNTCNRWLCHTRRAGLMPESHLMALNDAIVATSHYTSHYLHKCIALCYSVNSYLLFIVVDRFLLSQWWSPLTPSSTVILSFSSGIRNNFTNLQADETLVVYSMKCYPSICHIIMHHHHRHHQHHREKVSCRIVGRMCLRTASKSPR